MQTHVEVIVHWMAEFVVHQFPQTDPLTSIENIIWLPRYEPTITTAH